MTTDELNAAIERLIEEANVQTADTKQEYERDVLAAKNDAAKRRMYRGSALAGQLDELRAAYDTAVLRIQKDLDESIAALQAENEMAPGGSGGEDAPYLVDYSLPMRERYIIVKDYYLSYDAEQACLDLQQDTVAMDYLGNYYSYLLQLLRMISV